MAGEALRSRVGWHPAPADLATGALVAAWSVAVIAGDFGLAPVPHAHLLTAVVPLALAGLLVARPEPASAVLQVSAGWTVALALVLLGAHMVVTKPWTYSLALPGAAAMALAFTRWPAAGLVGAFGMTGVYYSLQAFTSLPVYQFQDALLAGLALSVAAAYITGRRGGRVRPRAALVGLVLFVIVSAIQALTVPNRAIGLDAFHSLAWGLVFLPAVAYAPWDESARERIVKGILLVACLVGGYAVLRWVIGPAAVERDHVLSLSRGYNFIDNKLTTFGSFLSFRHLGVWTAMVMPFCLALGFAWRGRWRLIAVTAFGLCAAALIASQMRAGLIAAIFGLALVLLLHVPARAFPGFRLGPVAGILVLVLASASVFAVRSQGAGGERYANLLQPRADFSYQQRVVKWREALDILDRDPQGQGMGSFGSTKVRAGGAVTLGTYDIDNSYLEIALNQGIAVLALFAASLLALVVALARAGVEASRRSDAGIAIGACGSLVTFMIAILGGTYVESLPAMAAWIVVGVGAMGIVRT